VVAGSELVVEAQIAAWVATDLERPRKLNLLARVRAFHDLNNELTHR